MSLLRGKIGLDQIGLDWIDFVTDKIVLFEMTCLCLWSRPAQFCRERKDLSQFGAFQIVTEDKVTQQQYQHLNSQSCDKETLHQRYRQHGLLCQHPQGSG